MSDFDHVPKTPDGWSRTTLGAIRKDYSGSINPEKHPDTKFEHYSVPRFEEGKPVVEKGEEIGSTKKIVEEDMVLLCKINPRINRAWRVGNYSSHPKIGSTEWIRFPPVEGIDPDYLRYYMSQSGFRNYLHLNASGAGGSLMRVNKSKVDKHPFLYPSLPEQRRIVAKIEELFSTLDAGMADLQTAGQQLERYRLSVLQAAVEGRLTADWRRTHDPEPADQLLERILENRREQWEKRYKWERYESKGKEPPSGWKDRYSEPEPYEHAEDLPQLPSSWEWTNLDHFTTKGPQNGLYLPKKKYGSGTPILRIDDFQNGWSRKSEELQKVEAEDDDIEKYSLKEGDLVINRVNSITHLGKCLFVEDRNLPSLFESNMMRLHLTSLCEGKFVEYYLRSPLGRQTLIQNAKHAVNQASINQGDVKETAIPLPPRAEQKQIVDEVERLLSVADDAAATTEREHTRAERLRQSILKQAFSGHLVPHDEDAAPSAIESTSENGTAEDAPGDPSPSSDNDDVVAEELYNGGDPGKQIEMDL